MFGRFKHEIPFEKRYKLSHKILSEYPDRIPIIVEPRSLTDPEINRKKFLAPIDSTMGSLFHDFRKQMISITPDKAIIFFVEDTFISSSSYITQIYSQHHDEDGFLYIVYTTESTFGSF